MKKVITISVAVFLVIVALIAVAGTYKFNYLSSKPGYDVDGNRIEPEATY